MTPTPESDAPSQPNFADGLETPKPLATFARIADMTLPCPACNSDGGSCSLCKGSVMIRTRAAPGQPAPAPDALRAATEAVARVLHEQWRRGHGYDAEGTWTWEVLGDGIVHDLMAKAEEVARAALASREPTPATEGAGTTEGGSNG